MIQAGCNVFSLQVRSPSIREKTKGDSIERRTGYYAKDFM